MGLDHSPIIVTDGLVFNIDSANLRSYSGSGNTIYDLRSGTACTFWGGSGFHPQMLECFIIMEAMLSE